MALLNIETQSYTTLSKEKNFEIRHYPEAILATVHTQGRSYRAVASSGFRQLANFIFGGNERSSRIAMTAPVHMEFDSAGSSMSFVMPSAYKSEDLPKPLNGRVKIEKFKEQHVAAIRFGGFAGDSRIHSYENKLKKMLDAKGISYSGNFRYLGYNSPYRLIGRRNEIIVPVAWKA